MLQEITALNIDYLHHLDYVDFNSLSHINKAFFKLLNNDTILRNILYKQCDNDIYLPPNFPILKALNDINNRITLFIYKLYPNDMKWPRWTNIEIFRSDLKKNVYMDLWVQICISYNNGRDISDINLFIDDINTIILSRVGLLLPFAAYNNEYLVISDVENNKFYNSFDKELQFTDTTLDYLKHSFEYFYNKYNKDSMNIDDKIYALFFIRDYTHESYFQT